MWIKYNEMKTYKKYKKKVFWQDFMMKNVHIRALV
jgi:hypothetical protein